MGIPTMKRCAAAFAAAVALTAPAALADGTVLKISPRHLGFGKQVFDTFTTATITVMNTASVAVVVAFEQVRVPDDFSPGQPGSTCSLPEETPLAPGASCTEIVAFSPIRAFAGHEQGTLTITARDPVSGAVVDTQTIKISGRGVEP